MYSHDQKQPKIKSRIEFESSEESDLEKTRFVEIKTDEANGPSAEVLSPRQQNPAESFCADRLSPRYLQEDQTDNILAEDPVSVCPNSKSI